MIRTVNGDIGSDNLENILVHEHIACVSNDMLQAYGDRWLDKKSFADYAAAILKAVKEKYGVSIYVDGTPIDLGRDVKLLKAVSDKSGMPIVASTGLYYFPGQLTVRRSAEELAELFIYECEKGMEGTEIRPGILKCATEQEVSSDNAKRLGAMGLVQAKTGLPLYAHCRHIENTAHEQLDILLAKGADPKKIVIGHASSRLDADYLESVLKRGCYISIDQSWSTEKESEVVRELCRRGYAERLLFSVDRPIYNEFHSAGDTGEGFDPKAHIDRYGFIFDSFRPSFIATGCTEDECDIMFKQNPARFLDF